MKKEGKETNNKIILGKRNRNGSIRGKEMKCNENDMTRRKKRIIMK